jgi:hypothetical protein
MKINLKEMGVENGSWLVSFRNGVCDTSSDKSPRYATAVLVSW